MTDLLNIQHISKEYNMDGVTFRALEDVTLSIKKGEYAAIMGPSGSGKSTLMHIIGCLDRPTSGSVSIEGRDIFSANDSELAEIRNRNIGFVFQQFNLLPRLTAVENVALPLVYAGVPKKQRTQKAMEVLEKVDLANRAHHKPNEMSGGQNQRVAIARALVNNPSIILADEPTGNLDSKTSYEIMSIFGKIHEAGNTLILVTHEEEISNFAHRIVRLKDGLIETDKRKQFKLATEL